MDRDRTAEALAAFRRCTCADPRFALGYLAQAGLLGRMNLGGRARAALDTAVSLIAELGPDALAWQGHDVTPGEIRALIATQRQLLGLPDATDAPRG